MNIFKQHKLLSALKKSINEEYDELSYIIKTSKELFDKLNSKVVNIAGKHKILLWPVPIEFESHSYAKTMQNINNLLITVPGANYIPYAKLDISTLYYLSLKLDANGPYTKLYNSYSDSLHDIQRGIFSIRTYVEEMYTTQIKYMESLKEIQYKALTQIDFDFTDDDRLINMEKYFIDRKKSIRGKIKHNMSKLTYDWEKLLLYLKSEYCSIYTN